MTRTMITPGNGDALGACKRALRQTTLLKDQLCNMILAIVANPSVLQVDEETGEVSLDAQAYHQATQRRGAGLTMHHVGDRIVLRAVDPKDAPRVVKPSVQIVQS